MVDRATSTRRRVMKEFVIREVSAVDRPAQGLARAVLMKRDADPLDKRDFSPEARDQMAQSGEAMPDGSFPIPDKGALARAVSSIGRAKNYDAARRHIIRRARALGAVDSLPEDWGVKKCLGDYPQVISLQEVEQDIEAMDFDAVMAAEQSREAAMRVKDCVWSCWNALQRSFDSIAGDDSLAPADKVGAMQESLAQFLDAVRAESATIADTIEKSISAAPALAELLPATGSEGGSPMTDAEKRQLDELQKSVADLTKKLEAATAKDVAKKAADLAGELEKAQAGLKILTEKLEKADAEKAEALAKAGMSDAEKAYCADMAPAEKAKFMSMSPEERMKAMKKSADADPVVYKSESTGEEFRKSDDPRLVKLAKQADEDRALAKQEREARENAEFAKQADDDLKEFSEAVAKRDDKIAVMRAVAKMDDGPREALRKMLAVGAKAISAAFDTIGHRNESVAKSAGAFEKRVSEVQARDKCNKVQALERAREEFPEEFKAYQGAN